MRLTGLKPRRPLNEQYLVEASLSFNRAFYCLCLHHPEIATDLRSQWRIVPARPTSRRTLWLYDRHTLHLLVTR